MTDVVRLSGQGNGAPLDGDWPGREETTMETRQYATDRRPAGLWEVVRLSTWTLSLALRSTTDLLDHPDSHRI